MQLILRLLYDFPTVITSLLGVIFAHRYECLLVLALIEPVLRLSHICHGRAELFIFGDQQF